MNKSISLTPGPTGNMHQKVLDTFPSAGRMAKETGIPVSTCKYWKRNGHIHDPGRWSTVWSAARLLGFEYGLADTVLQMAEDYNHD